MNLTIAILDFGVRLYGDSELSKHLSKCLLMMKKKKKKKKELNPIPFFFMTSKVSAHRVSKKLSMRFFHIHNPKNLSRTETLHTESDAY